MALAAAVLETSQKRELVQRVANSEVFRRSPRLRELLLYVAECTLNDRLEDAREQQIAQNVFRRGADYNSTQDNIVRVEARSLRKRLDLFFNGDGRDEPVIIIMPKGGYALEFQPRISEPMDAEPATVVDRFDTSPLVSTTPDASFLLLERHLRVALAAIAILAGVAVLSWYSARAFSGRFEQRSPILPLSAVAGGSDDVFIVTSDTSLILIQKLTGKQVSLDEYIMRQYPDDSAAATSALADIIRTLQNRHYTNASEAGVAGQIIQSHSRDSRRFVLRSSRQMQLPDFKSHNVILLGGPLGNPWVRLYSDNLNFHFEIDSERRGRFRNRSPQPGEQTFYSMTTDSGESGAAYAVVALLPNVNPRRHVLLIAGTTAEGTQAAGEFILDDERKSSALRAIGIDPSGPPRYFEILLKVDAIAGNSNGSRVVAHRLIAAK